MIVKVILPKSGMGIDEGTISRWLKMQGDRIEKGQVLAEVETAKALQEVEAPITGTVIALLVAEGQSASVNSVIAEIDSDG